VHFFSVPCLSLPLATRGALTATHSSGRVVGSSEGASYRPPVDSWNVGRVNRRTLGCPEHRIIAAAANASEGVGGVVQHYQHGPSRAGCERDGCPLAVRDDDVAVAPRLHGARLVGCGRCFVEVCDLIQDRGRALPWPKPPSRPRYRNSYLVLAPLKFWAMGPRGDQDEPRDRNVVNCALAELDELAHDDAASVNQTGAWSDLLTRLSGLLQASSSPAPSASTRDDAARGLSAACVRWSCRPGHYPLP
jgi:hypothetical protein